MIIFQRVLNLLGPPQEVLPWAMEVTEHVNAETELDVALWQSQFGQPLGTVAWTCILPNLTALEAATESLGADQAYVDLTSRAQDWISAPGEDHLIRISHVAGGDYKRPGVGAYAEMTAAVPAEGQLAAASAWAVEIADLHSDVTHAPVLFGGSAYGDFGLMAWVAFHDSAASVDEAAEAIGKDQAYVAKLDQGGDLFTPGSATRALARRIA